MRTILGLVADKRQLTSRYDFWRSMPWLSYAVFLTGVFALFLPAGLLTDIPKLGANSPRRLVSTALLSGGLAVAYMILGRFHRKWLPLLVAMHVLVVAQFDRLVGPVGVPLTGDALSSRLALDVNGSTVAIIVAFILLSNLIMLEATRYVRAHAEIALASDIHKRLVPSIARRVGGYEFRGVSIASGEVGGDLIDLVETPRGWTSYVMDVSGHGV